MAKTTTYSTVRNIRQVIRFNEPTTITSTDANNLTTSTPGFYAAVVVSEMQAVASDGGLRDWQQRTPVGAARATIFTPTELANMVQGSANSTGNFLLSELTAVYTSAIGGLS